MPRPGSSKVSDPRIVVAAAFLAGVAIRVLSVDYVTGDWNDFLQPWYDHARLHGVAGLKDAFTNYAPFYTYLLIVAAAFDGLASPVALVKGIGYPFEIGCALVGARLVRLIDPRPERAAFAFAALWLSPSVLHNGPFWAQCDAVWTFFVLLALWAACEGRTRWAVAAFGVAVSVKLQAAFLAPFMLGVVIRRRESVAWFALVPAIYAALALPALLAGRPPAEIATVYLGQAGYFPMLWKGAANLYALVPPRFYHPGLEIGLALALTAGLGLAAWIARARTVTAEGLLLAGAMSLALMPFLLPKMHDRFFFAFDAVIVVLACVRAIYRPVAVAALFNSMICYLPFDGLSDFGQGAAGLQTLVILLFLGMLLSRSFEGRDVSCGDPERDRMGFVRPTAALWFSYLAYSAAKPGLARLVGAREGLWPDVPPEPIGIGAFLVSLVLAVLALRALDRARRPVPAAA